MNSITLRTISKMATIAFIFYVLWFRYSFRQSPVILNGTAGIAIGCVVLDMFLMRSNIKELIPPGVTINLIMCIYSLVTGVFVAYSYDILLAQVKTLFAFSCMSVVMGYICMQEKSIDWLIHTLIALAVTCCLFVTLRGYSWQGYGHTLSEDHNPNNLGVTMCMGLFALAYKGKPNTKAVFYAVPLAVLFLYFVVGSGSRKSLIAAGMICSLWAWPMMTQTWKNGSPAKRLVLVLIFLLIGAGVWYYFTNVYITSDSYERMQTLGDSDEGSSGLRMLYYKLSIEYLMESPFFGLGLYHFIVWNPFHQMSHSTYAEALSCWGLVGSCIYFYPFLRATVRAFLMAFRADSNYMDRIILTLVITEFFLGVGQVFFYEIQHMILWTLIFIYQALRDEKQPGQEKQCEIRHCKYIKA